MSNEVKTLILSLVIMEPLIYLISSFLILKRLISNTDNNTLKV